MKRYLVVLIFLLAAVQTAATDYYVRVDGSNTICDGLSNAPSTSTPNCAWATPGKCLGFGGAFPGSGDRCLITTGTYYGYNGYEDREQSNSGLKKSGSHANCQCAKGSSTITCTGVDVTSVAPTVGVGDFVQCTDGYGFSWTEVGSAVYAGGNSTITLVEGYRGCDYSTCDGDGDGTPDGSSTTATATLEVAQFVQILGWDVSLDEEVSDITDVVLTAWVSEPGDVEWVLAGTCDDDGATLCANFGDCGGGFSFCQLSSCVYMYDVTDTANAVWQSSAPQGYREDFDVWDIWDGTDNDEDGTVDSAGPGRGDPLRDLRPSDAANACGTETAFQQVSRVPGSWAPVGTKRIVHSYTCADPDSLSMQTSIHNPLSSSYLLNSSKPYSIVGSLTLEAGIRDPNDSNGSIGLLAGENDSLYRNILQRTGQIVMQMDADDSDLRYESIDAWWAINLSTGGQTQSHSGLHFYDIEARGGRNSSWTTDHVIGASAQDRIWFDRLYVHRGSTHWKADTWDCVNDVWLQPYRAAHGLYVGSASANRNINHVTFQNGIYETTFDGLGVFVARGNTDVIVRNNTFGYEAERLFTGNQIDGDFGLTFVNNVFLGHDHYNMQAFGLGSGVGCALDNLTADYNAYLSPGNVSNEANDEHWWVSNGCGAPPGDSSSATFQQVVNPAGYGQEANSFFVCTGVTCSGTYGTYYNDASIGWVDYDPHGGGTDYSPTVTSRLVDAGDTANCPAHDYYGNPRYDGDGDGTAQCDIGAVEYVVATVACDDGLDNDGDGSIDYPADSGCSSSLDPDERLCGDNFKDSNEVCDGTALGGESCASLGYGSGSLACLGNCSGYNFVPCMYPYQQSDDMTSVTWKCAARETFAGDANCVNGSDIWPITLGPTGDFYAAWGDGRGFCNHASEVHRDGDRVWKPAQTDVVTTSESYGFSLLEGPWDQDNDDTGDWVAYDLNSCEGIDDDGTTTCAASADGKIPALVSVDGIVYSLYLRDKGTPKGVDTTVLYTTDITNDSSFGWCSPMIWPDGFGETAQGEVDMLGNGTGDSEYFFPTTILQYGPDYRQHNDPDGDGTRQLYVYGSAWIYDHECTTDFTVDGPGDYDWIFMARVVETGTPSEVCTGWEYLSGPDADTDGIFDGGTPTWSTNITDRVAIFEDDRGVGNTGAMTVEYNAALGKYLMEAHHRCNTACPANCTEMGGLNDIGIYESDTPWGPWRTVYYANDWCSAPETEALGSTLTSNSLWYKVKPHASTPSIEMHYVTSSSGSWDSFNEIPATMFLAPTECNDGLDNDDDGSSDWPNDPGCATLLSAYEGADCDNDGVKEGAEQCDGTDFGGATCVSMGYYCGNLGCDNCVINTGTCVSGFCTDTTIQAACGEQCDIGNLGGNTCTSVGGGFTHGDLDCLTDTCRFDTSSCETCGDGVIETLEACDCGGDACTAEELNNETCTTLGYGTGTLSCSANCLTFDVSGCTILPGMCGIYGATLRGGSIP